MELGKIVPLITVGGSSNAPNSQSLSARWLEDPSGTLVDKFGEAEAWCIFNALPRTCCIFQPAGYPRDANGNGPKVMPLDAWPVWAASNSTWAAEMLLAIESVVRACSSPPIIYTGSLYDHYERGSRYSVRDCIKQYAYRGKTIIAFDQSADLEGGHWPELRWIQHAFEEVIVEGAFRQDNQWMRNRGVRNCVVGTWAPSQPYIYSKIRASDYVIITSVPNGVENPETWRLEKAAMHLKRGVNVIMSVSHLGTTTYLDLIT